MNFIPEKLAIDASSTDKKNLGIKTAYSKP